MYKSWEIFKALANKSNSKKFQFVFEFKWATQQKRKKKQKHISKENWWEEPAHTSELCDRQDLEICRDGAELFRLIKWAGRQAEAGSRLHVAGQLIKRIIYGQMWLSLPLSRSPSLSRSLCKQNAIINSFKNRNWTSTKTYPIANV